MDYFNGNPLSEINPTKAQFKTLEKNIRGKVQRFHKKTGTIHQDLHGRNILVDKDMNVRVVDYELAKRDNAVIKEIGTKLWGIDGKLIELKR